jgi:hypothetical protein
MTYQKLTYSGTECKNYVYFAFDAEYFDIDIITDELKIEPTSVMIKKAQYQNRLHGITELMLETKLTLSHSSRNSLTFLNQK